jgi:hypothetical protein
VTSEPFFAANSEENRESCEKPVFGASEFRGGAVSSFWPFRCRVSVGHVPSCFASQWVFSVSFLVEKVFDLIDPFAGVMITS